MTKQDFIDWKNNPVTKAFFKTISEHIEGLKEELAYSAGIDPRRDAIRVGGITVYRDILENTEWAEDTE